MKRHPSRKHSRRNPLLHLLGIVIKAFVLLVCILAFLLAGTTSGARWLAGMAVRHEPRLSLRVVGGSLWSGLALRDVSWRDARTDVAIDSFETRWQPSPWRRPALLRVNRLHADGIRIALATGTTDDELRAPSVRRGAILPLDLHLQDVSLTRISISLGDSRYEFDALSASADLVENRIELHSLQLANGPDWTVRCSGEIDRSDSGWSLDLESNAKVLRLKALVPSLSGDASGAFRIAGPVEALSIAGSVSTTGIEHESGLQVGSTRLEVQIADLAHGESSASLTSEDLRLPSGMTGFHSLRLDAQGTRPSHTATLVVSGAGTSAEVALAGSLDRELPGWRGSLNRVSLAAADFLWTLGQPTELHWDRDARQLVVAPHLWRHKAAELRVPEPLRLGRDGTAAWQLSHFELSEFQRWLPSGLELRGTLASQVSLRWQDGTPTLADLGVSLHDAGLRLTMADEVFSDETPPLDFAFETMDAKAKLADGEFSASLNLGAPELGSLQASATLPLAPELRATAGAGTLRVDKLQLAAIQPFVPELKTLAGEINADLEISGNLRRPRLHGTVALTQGALEPAAFPIALGDLHLAGELHGDSASWTGGFRSGEGQATLEGDMHLHEEGWKAAVRLAGEKLELAYGTLVVLQAQPDLLLTIVPGLITLEGSVRIPQADITIQQLPRSAVRISSDVVDVDAAESDTVEAASNGSAPSRQIELDLRLGDRVAISGYGMTGRLAGNLRFLQTDRAAPAAFGELQIKDGRYRAYGQRLQIRQGRFLFAGPLDRAYLTLEAIREAPAHRVVAGIRVEGVHDALESSIFSEPDLPEEEILAFLLLGRPLVRGEESDSNVMMARAALSLGIAQGGGRVTDYVENLGIEDFEIDTAGEGDDTQVVVSGQISSRLRVSYGSGVFAPANTLTLRYRLARRLYLEAVTGVESALDLLYTFSF